MTALQPIDIGTRVQFTLRHIERFGTVYATGVAGVYVRYMPGSHGTEVVQMEDLTILERPKRTSDRCHWCGRDTSDGDYLNVDSAEGIVRCCSTCWERGDEGIDIPLDMTEDVP